MARCLFVSSSYGFKNDLKHCFHFLDLLLVYIQQYTCTLSKIQIVSVSAGLQKTEKVIHTTDQRCSTYNFFDFKNIGNISENTTKPYIIEP